MKFKRVYHPYWLWEEIDYNMWGSPDNKPAQLKKAVKFTADHKLYGRFMMRVAREWKHSCENALTDYRHNRKAWIGHAAVALAHGIPESIVREAWRELTDEQRLLANREAERAIQFWENSYAKSNGLCGYMEDEMLFC